MATIIANKLSARIVFMGKASNIGIYCGPVLVATAVLGGKWTEAHALKEFVRLTHRFKPAKGMTVEQMNGWKCLAA
jgi:hypothetical protein